jgi:chromosome segregation ATPase
VDTLATQLRRSQEKSAELAMQLRLRERVHCAVVNDLDRERRALQEQVERLQREIATKEAERVRLEGEYSRLVETATLRE